MLPSSSAVNSSSVGPSHSASSRRRETFPGAISFIACNWQADILVAPAEQLHFGQRQVAE